MKIKLASVFVDNQDKALEFYTKVLGFVQKRSIPVGAFKFLTVVSAEEPNGTELLLEPNDNPIAKTYQQGLFNMNRPATSFFVDDIQKEYERMKVLGVEFLSPPQKFGPTTFAVLNDTCGNFIQINQVNT